MNDPDRQQAHAVIFYSAQRRATVLLFIYLLEPPMVLLFCLPYSKFHAVRYYLQLRRGHGQGQGRHTVMFFILPFCLPERIQRPQHLLV